MDNIRRPMPVSVPHMVSLSNEEVDRIVMARLREISHGISKEFGKIVYQGIVVIWNDSELKDLEQIVFDGKATARDREIYLSYLAHQLYWVLHSAPKPSS